MLHCIRYVTVASTLSTIKLDGKAMVIMTKNNMKAII